MIPGQVYTATLHDLEYWPAACELLARHGIVTVADVAQRTRDELLALPGFGERKLAELERDLRRIDVKVGELK